MSVLTAKQRETLFREELQALLDKYDAELEITDDGGQYGMQCPVVEVMIPAFYDNNTNELTAEYTEFRL